MDEGAWGKPVSAPPISTDTMVAPAGGLLDAANASGKSFLVSIYPAGQGRGLIDLPPFQFTIGRGADCDLAVTDSAISRKHARIELRAGSYMISDLGSTNGTFVNDERVDKRLLANGDFLRIGSHIFKFLSGDHFEAQYHETIYTMMTTDGLTGVNNKRVFSETLDRELVRSQRRLRPLALVMFDIDHFKSINDSHGHLAGDAVLRDICARIRLNVRKDEIFARYGGEEFVVLLPEATLEEAQGFAERLRTLVGEVPVNVNSIDIPVTVSIGVAFTPGHPEVTPEALVAEADAKLYEAKRSGRNCVRW